MTQLYLLPLPLWFCCLRQISRCSSGRPRTPYADKTGPKLTRSACLCLKKCSYQTLWFFFFFLRQKITLASLKTPIFLPPSMLELQAGASKPSPAQTWSYPQQGEDKDKPHSVAAMLPQLQLLFPLPSALYSSISPGAIPKHLHFQSFLSVCVKLM